MIRRLIIITILLSTVNSVFAQKLLIVSQNYTKGHNQYGLVANKVNEHFFNKTISRKQFKYLSQCIQSDSTIAELAKKFRDLYPGLSYGHPAIEFPVTHNSDTMWYEQTFVKIKKRKKKIKYYLQIKVIFKGSDPDGYMYFPYIQSIEVRGPGEIHEYDPKDIFSKLSKN